MTTDTTNPRPHVPPPPGAAIVDDWQPQQYRIVYGRRREVGEVDVSTSVAQLADGTINRSSEKYDPPLVHVDTMGAFELTTEQARELAGAILDAVNELDGWTTMSALNMWVDRQQAAERVCELTERVSISDLTTLELLAFIALLEPADERVNGHRGHTATVHLRSTRGLTRTRCGGGRLAPSVAAL